MKTILIGIPAFNEEDNIVPLLERFSGPKEDLQSLDFRLRVMVVDDGSRDQTVTRVENLIRNRKDLPVELVQHGTNKGLASAVETIFEKANAEKDLWALGLLDGDDSHNPETFLHMFEKMKEGFDVVVASRFQAGAEIHGVPMHRQWMSVGMSLIFRAFGRIHRVRDYSCGFRLYKSHIVQKLHPLQFRYRSFACMVELLKRCQNAGATFAEVPFCLRYDRKKGDSKMRFFRTITDTLKVLWTV